MSGSTSNDYRPRALGRAQVEAQEGATVLDFGTSWCGYCRAAAPAVDRAVAQHPRVRHVRIEDGPGRPLGRSYGVKRWPTLIFLEDGVEVSRLVRPVDAAAIEQELARIAGA